MNAINTPSNSGKGRVFKNPFIEKLTRTHISLPLVTFSAISTFLVYKGMVDFGLATWQIGALSVAGYFAFTLVEYMMHRFVFHMKEDTDVKKKVVYALHGIHHDYPKDKDRLAMPVPASLTLATGFYFLFKLLMGDLVFGFLPGFLMGYAWYLWVHYMVHAMQPPKNLFKIFWVHHGIHHYKQPERAFGVSMPFWDFVFRTLPK
ncbi:MAG: sterol desaturase family protein [Reichenbachiella sp.]